jgi:hypothetical protein
MLIAIALVVTLALALFIARRRAGRAEREQMAARLDQLPL